MSSFPNYKCFNSIYAFSTISWFIHLFAEFSFFILFYFCFPFNYDLLAKQKFCFFLLSLSRQRCDHRRQFVVQIEAENLLYKWINWMNFSIFTWQGNNYRQSQPTHCGNTQLCSLEVMFCALALPTLSASSFLLMTINLDLQIAVNVVISISFLLCALI